MEISLRMRRHTDLKTMNSHFVLFLLFNLSFSCLLQGLKMMFYELLEMTILMPAISRIRHLISYFILSVHVICLTWIEKVYYEIETWSKEQVADLVLPSSGIPV